jgi:hypothetical protein
LFPLFFREAKGSRRPIIVERTRKGSNKGYKKGKKEESSIGMKYLSEVKSFRYF